MVNIKYIIIFLLDFVLPKRFYFKIDTLTSDNRQLHEHLEEDRNEINFLKKEILKFEDRPPRKKLEG